MDQIASRQQLYNNQSQNAQTIQTQMQADNQKQATERWKIQEDVQTKIMEIRQDVTNNRAKAQEKSFQAMDQYIRS